MATSTKTHIVLADEATRRLIQRVIWDRSIRAIGISFEDRLGCLPEDDDDRYREVRTEAAQRVQAFRELTEMVDRVEATAIGVTLDPDISSQLASHAEDVSSYQRGIEESSFWSSSHGARDRLLEDHAAAVALAEQLAQVEAVA
jgi:hypothetical protein